MPKKKNLMTKSEMKEFGPLKKILVILPNYIGDVMMATPALHLLKKFSPDSNIYVLTTSVGREILEANPDIDEIITRPLKLKFKDRISLIKNVKKLKPDCVLLFRTTFFNSLLSYLSGAEIRAGVNREFSGIFLNKLINEDKKRRFRDEYLKILFSVFPCKNDFAKDEEIYKMRIYTDQNDKKFADEILSGYRLKDNFAVIMASTTRHSKNWPLKNYALVIDGLKDRFGLTTVLVGSENDFMANEKIIEFSKHKSINLAGKTNLRQLAEIIRRASLFIGPDTGAMYISSAVGTNTIALFGSTDSEKCGPFDESKQIIIYKKFSCSPCHKNFCSRASKNEIAPCMDSITPEEVLEKVELFKDFHSRG